MNLFKKAGEKYEKTKQAFVSGKEMAYVCDSCEEQLDREYEQCPHCGAKAVELRE